MVITTQKPTFYAIMSQEQRLQIRLADLFDFANAPLYLLDEVTKILAEEAGKGLNFRTAVFQRRKTFISGLGKLTNVPNFSLADVRMETYKWHPTTVKNRSTTLRDFEEFNNEKTDETRESLTVVKYDFLEQVTDLLQSEELFTNLDNFKGTIRDPESDPFSGKPSRSDSIADEVMSGLWYQKTYNEISTREDVKDEDFFVVPIIMYLDKTGTDKYLKYGLEPVIFTTPLLNRKARNRANAWRTLGFIPDIYRKSTAENEELQPGGYRGAGINMRNYHRLLDVVLESFYCNQGNNKSIYRNVTIGRKTKKCRVFFPLAFVIGDGLSGDHLCGRTGARHNCARLSRSCNVPHKEADNVMYRCTFLHSSDFDVVSDIVLRHLGLHDRPKSDEESTDSEESGPPVTAEQFRQSKQFLLSHSQHYFSSAFRRVWFGSNKRGIMGASPPDTLHMVDSGVAPNSTGMYLAPWKQVEKAQLDILCNRVHYSLRSSRKDEYPRCTFKRGITNLTLLTANEWMGVLFTILVIGASRDGKRLMWSVVKRLDPDYEVDVSRFHVDASILEGDEKRNDYLFYDDEESQSTDEDDHSPREEDREIDDEPITNYPVTQEDEMHGPDAEFMAVLNEQTDADLAVSCDPDGYTNLLEMILSFQAWYKLTSEFPVEEDDIEKMQDAIRVLLLTLKKRTPNSANWKLQKFHDFMHLVPNIRMYGSPSNWDAGPGERLLKDFAKKPARNAQKRSMKEFLKQTNNRLREREIISQAMSSIPEENAESLRMRRMKERLSRETKMSNETGDDPILDDEVQSELVGKMKYILRFVRNYGPSGRTFWNVNFEWCRLPPPGFAENRIIHSSILRWLERNVDAIPEWPSDDTDIVDLHCWTDYIRDGVSFRAHPNYRRAGPWYDWVMVKYEVDLKDYTEEWCGNFDPYFFPSKILSFFQVEGGTGTYAIIHTCETNKQLDQNSSVLLERWTLQYKRVKAREAPTPAYDIQDVECFGEGVLVIEDRPGLFQTSIANRIGKHIPYEVTLVIPRKYWPKKFLSAKKDDNEYEGE